MLIGMEAILRGVLRYTRSNRHGLVHSLQNASQNQPPKAVMFTCMDCRLLPHQITSSAPGDMFVVRNPGNMVPPSRCLSVESDSEPAVSVSAEAAALHLTCRVLGLRDVIVCGHSDCKAVALLHETHGTGGVDSSPLHVWVDRMGAASVARLAEISPASHHTRRLSFAQGSPLCFSAEIDPQLPVVDQLSQVHALQQVENVLSHECVRGPVLGGQLRVHALWLELTSGFVHYFSRRQSAFVPINSETALSESIADCRLSSS